LPIGDCLRLSNPKQEQMTSTETAGTNVQERAKDLSREGPFGHILLVDDDPIFRSITRLTLIQLGHSVTVADDAKSAFEAITKNKDIPLLVTDVVMPGLNGVLLARGIRAIRPGCKVLYISGYPRSTLTATGESGDSVYFLQKPFERSELDRCIKRILSGKS
jgi:DNA-binding NtrC family response regulator